MDFNGLVLPYASIIFSYAWKVIVIILATWGIITSFKRIGMIEMPSRIKACIPIILGVLWMCFLSKEYATITEKLSAGIFMGVLSTSAYELLLDKVLAFFESALDKIFAAKDVPPPANQ